MEFLEFGNFRISQDSLYVIKDDGDWVKIEHKEIAKTNRPEYMCVARYDNGISGIDHLYWFGDYIHKTWEGCAKEIVTKGFGYDKYEDCFDFIEYTDDDDGIWYTEDSYAEIIPLEVAE